MNKELGNIFFHLLRQLLQEHTALWQKELPDLTKQQYAVLCAVYARPGIEQIELMDAALSTKATLAELLVRMESKEYVVRKEGENDKRRRFITLTAKGEQMLKSAQPVADKVDAYFLEKLPNAEQITLVDMLKGLLRKDL
ncbi:MarR family winged helix-turn-helix transcriptional regulator [Pantoea sp. KPR_PJ]|uniref:MarR family winged helix-turn-helix transcriptional regulator n=1 Tax=Pantoea sp. KPR_PJ TaxID=2738375 RepID=UPI00352901E6